MVAMEMADPRLHGTNGGFIGWLRHPQRGLPYLICSVLAILLLLPLLIHYYLSSVAQFDDLSQSRSGRLARSDKADKFGPMKASELKQQIEELHAIRSSVQNELLELEKKRQTLLAEISGYTSSIENLKQTFQATSEELNKLKVSFANLQVRVCT